MSPLDPSSVIPFRAGTTRRRSWRDSLAAGAAEAAVSLVFNLILLAALAHLAFPRIIDNREPQAIAVDLVPEPARRGTEADKTATPAHDTPPAQSTKGPPVAAPTKPAKPQPSPQTMPDTKAPEPAAAAPETTPSGQGDRSEPPTAAPAPIEGNRDAAPRIVEAPTTPGPAPTQTDKPVTANAEATPAEAAHPAEQPPAPAPAPVATSAVAAEAVPPPSSAAETPPPAAEPSAADKREAENTAKLAAALPFAQNFVPTFARSALAGSGDVAVQKYRGTVYGQFHKADDLIADARAAHLRGQTVVEFAIDDAGALTAIRVAVSSGQPEVDRIAEDIIRRSAPFPPPPPGAQHVFSPAIRLGLDE